jgi:CBS domain containing-hemolysin-like protein
MTADVWVSLIIGFVLLLFSAFFSGSETALFSLPRERLLELRTHQRASAKLINLLEHNPLGLLVTLLFGNLVVNVLFFCFTAAWAHQVGQSHGIAWQATLNGAALFMLILFGEIIPKSISMSAPLRILEVTAFPLRCWHILISPLRVCLEALTSRMTLRQERPLELRVDELKLLIDLTQTEGAFGAQEKAIVEEMIKLPEVRIRELMVPRVEQTFWDGVWTIAQAQEYAIEHAMDIMPVYLEQEEQVIGYVEISHLYAAADPSQLLRSLVTPIRFVPETKRADEMFNEFMSIKMKMVAVVDEYGGLAGTLRMRDLIGEMVGETEQQERPAVETISPTAYRLRGNLSVREWRELFIGFIPELTRETLALDTVSGLVVSLLKRLPQVGDEVRVGNLCFTVEQVRSHRIERVRLELIHAEGELP